MIYHVLPGDAVVDTFREANIEGEVIICRDALIEGPVNAESPEALWSMRERYFTETYPEIEGDYRTKVAEELAKLRNLRSAAEVNLWFENELFCQVNMWFCMSLVGDTNADVYRVLPAVKDEADKWKGFGLLTQDELNRCYSERIAITSVDLQFGTRLWDAFRTGDNARLARLCEQDTATFPYLSEVCDAAIAMDDRPREILKEITSNGEQAFSEIFSEFAARAGVYGYGDTQVRRLLGEIRSMP